MDRVSELLIALRRSVAKSRMHPLAIIIDFDETEVLAEVTKSVEDFRYEVVEGGNNSFFDDRSRTYIDIFETSYRNRDRFEFLR